MSEQDLRGTSESRDIAIIGMAGRFPGATNLTEFWRNLREGREAVTFFTDAELLAAGVAPATLHDPSYVKAGSMLLGSEEFDASFFGYSAREAEIMDPQQRLFLEHAWEALEDAGCVPGATEGLIGIYAGVAWNTYLLSNLIPHRDLFEGADGFQVFITNDKDFMPTRVSYKLDLKGPSLIVQTSCSTSLVAVHLACLSLLNFECDIALAGGVTVRVPQRSGYFYQEGGLASPDGHCRTFDARGQGTLFGSGIGIVVLKRLPDALADGDRIRAVIKGSAINNDGSLKVSYTAPSVEGQAEVIAAAQAVADVEPASIRYVEAHGTATALGDPIEVAALTKVFRVGTEKKSFCALGSVKSNIGHLDAAAGVAGLIKTVLALEHREIPPSLHFESPNPRIDFAASPFYVNTRLSPWPADGSPRRAGVSSFGVGGTNAHIILEEAPPPPLPATSRPWQLLLVSAKTSAALERATDELAAHLESQPEICLADAAYTSQVGRAVFRYRRTVVCASSQEAATALARRDGGQVFTRSDGEEPHDLPVVFLFPGQGAQHADMGRELYQVEHVFREEVDRCARLLIPHLGLDLRNIIYPDQDGAEKAREQLGRTALAQPALFVVEHALARLWMSWGVRPVAMIGHSVGEYVAACLAGVFSLEQSLDLVAARGRMMQELPQGVMLAVPVPEEDLCQRLGPNLSLAAVNGPARCVVSGPAEAVSELQRELLADGIDSRRLHTSHAFHSAMMEPILAPFAARVRDLRRSMPRIPFISNVTGTWITGQEATDPAYWARHLRQTVLFSTGMAELLRDPGRVFLEVGPGQTLATSAGRLAPGRLVLPSLRHPQQETSDLALLLGSFGRLWLEGLKVDWPAFWAGERRRRTTLPTYPFERRRYWIEPLERASDIPSRMPLLKREDPTSWLYLPTWKRSLRPRPSRSGDLANRPRNWLVFLDSHSLGAALAGRLRQAGHAVVTVRPGEEFARVGDADYTIDPRQRGGYEALAEHLTTDGPPACVLHLWSLTAAAGGDFQRAQEHGLYSLLFLVQALAKRFLPPALEIAVVANRSQSVTADEPIEPEKAPLLGLLRVLPQEFPGLSCRLLDVTMPVPADRSQDRLVDLLLSELRGNVDDAIVAYRGRERWVPAWTSVRPEVIESSLLRQRGIYLVTGGLSGHGFALSRWLAAEMCARLVLVEDFIPELEQRSDTEEKWRWLVEAGAEVLLLHVDLADAGQMQAAVQQAVARFGHLDGAIHAAGRRDESAFRAIQEIDSAELERYFRLKVHGAQALAGALAGLDLDFCLLDSSLATVLGGRGQTAAAAANLFLDAFAQSQTKSQETPWISAAWDAVLLDGEELGIARMSAELADLAMTPAELGDAFRHVLAFTGADRVVVSTGDLETRITALADRLVSQEERSRAGVRDSSAQHERPDLGSPYVAPRTETERKIAEVWQRALGFERVGLDDNFFELGGDSFVAIQVISWLKKHVGLDLPVARLYQGPTVRGLAALVEDSAGAAVRKVAQFEERAESMSRRRQYQYAVRSRKRVEE